MVSLVDVITVPIPKKFRGFAEAVADFRSPRIMDNPRRRRGRTLAEVRHDFITGTLGELVTSLWVDRPTFEDAGKRLSDESDEDHDGGVDFTFVTGRNTKFDTKTSQSKGISVAPALYGTAPANYPFTLSVSCAIGPETIYNKVFLDANGTEANLIGWIWGDELRRVWSGCCRWNDLGTMRDLRSMIDSGQV